MGIQFNVTTAKNFRNTLAKWYVAKNQVTDYANKRNDQIKAAKAIITADRDTLDEIAKGTYTGSQTKEALEKDIATMESRVETIRKEYTDACAKVEDSLTKAQNLVKDYEGLYKAYEAAAKGHFADEAYTAYCEAIAKFFQDNGLADATAENVSRYARSIGAKVLGAKASYKQKSVTGAQSKNVFVKIFLGNLADILADEGVISPAKYAYVPLSERNKDKK